jgi:hypothetical protein
MLGVKNDMSITGGGKIFVSSVDDRRKTMSELIKKAKCKKIKLNFADCEKDFDKAYSILLGHQKRFVVQMQAEQTKKEREMEKFRRAFAM